MEGKTDPSVKNYLARHWSLGERVEAHEVMESLLAHPGWQMVDELVEQIRLQGFDRLAVDSLPENYAELARRLGVQNGVTFHRDVVASVIDSAKTAVSELKRTAALDVAAEGK